MNDATNNPFDDSNAPAGADDGLGRVAGGTDGSGDAAPDEHPSPSPLAASLFPPWLSSWMVSPANWSQRDGDDDDGSSYHDCVSAVDSGDDASSSSRSHREGETTSLLAQAEHREGALGPPRHRVKFYGATSSAPVVDSSTHNSTRSSAAEHSHVYDGIASPFAQALTTWLSPYAESARRAGRNLFQFAEDASAGGLEPNPAPAKKGYSNETDGRSFEVRFQDFRDAGDGEEGNRNLGSLYRVNSSPALMTSFSDEKWNDPAEGNGANAASSQTLGRTDYGTIVLRDIDIEGDHHETEDGSFIHPWTKLILLEELGTAWSWFVLLLPYFFMIVAVFLDGDTSLKNTTVGPLSGERPCAKLAHGTVPTPFDESVKGYYPVPFRLADGDERASGKSAKATALFPGPCSYPFELRDGVGLLSHGENAYSNLTSVDAPKKTSIVDARYRYLMSHGHAFTSGVIPNVPPTSESLRGSAKFNDLSSNAVSLVTRGSVLVSVVVFQRQTPAAAGMDSGSSGAESDPAVKHWSPVLILSSKRLDMTCKLNKKKGKTQKREAPSWSCKSSRIIDAFFSLPNTAVLLGGDLRVDVLLSHHKTHNSLLAEDLRINERGGLMYADDDYIIQELEDGMFDLSEADKILSSADVSHPQELLAEMCTKSVYTLEHESMVFNDLVEATRIFSLAVTMLFLLYWLWSIGIMDRIGNADEDAPETNGPIQFMATKIKILCRSCDGNNPQGLFWWQDPWITFPERRYLLMLLICLMMLQNPMLAYAFFHLSLYRSSWFRFAADSLTGVSIHGIMFLWLCLVHGLRYHTAEISRRRLDQHRRVLELRKATSHMSPVTGIDDNGWDRVRWYYNQYGDVDGGYSQALCLKHDINSDSFVEFMVPKLTLLVVGMLASITLAASKFPISEKSVAERAELNPDRFGSSSKAYVLSSIVQLIVVQIWCVFILYTSFITGERLRREPFLSTRPAQLSFRVLSAILLLGVLFTVSLFCVHSLNLIGNASDKEDELSYDTSLGGSRDSWDADVLFQIQRIASTVPYVGSATNMGPGKILYATACSLVVAHIFLPSSHFHPSKQEQKAVEEIAMGPDQYSRQTILSDMDKRLQGKDKRFVVALARNTHTWRVFPLPMRSHGVLSQHSIKEALNILGTFQLSFDGGMFRNHKMKYGRGAIYKGRYTPVFCVEIACWLLEACWQAYYSSSGYSWNESTPGRMRLDSIGLKLEHAIDDSQTDTHAFVASNVSDQVEGEEDSIIVVAFRGSASITNVRTDLSFRLVPLTDRIMSDVPAFVARPGKPVSVDPTLWSGNSSSFPSAEDDHHQLSGPHAQKAESHGTHVDRIDNGRSSTVPTVSGGAKAVLREIPMARQALPCVHEGFLENYSEVRLEIIEAVIAVFKRQLERSIERSRRGSSVNDGAHPLTLPKLYITGHSMGGAYAQLLALDLSSNLELEFEQPIAGEKERNSDGLVTSPKQSLSSLEHGMDEEPTDSGDIFWLGKKLMHQNAPAKKVRISPPIAVYTYGQSRVGNKAFKALYKKRVPHTFRVVTEGDAITSMPTFGPFCGGIYRHAGLEVLLEQGCTGNILVGPTQVETVLRFTKVRTSMAVHSLERYRESLESALGRDDLDEYYRGHGGKVRHDNQGLNSSNHDTLPSWVTNIRRSRNV